MFSPTGIFRNRWLIVSAAGIIMGMALGIRHVQGLFLQPVVSSQGWSREVFGFALALQNLVWGLTQPFTGMIADRFGAARVLFVGMLAYALGLLLMAIPASPLQFTLANGALIGFALSGTAFGAVYGALNRIFAPEQRAWALAMAGAMGGLGQFCMVPFVQSLLGRVSWEASAIVLCLAMLALSPLAAFLRDGPASRQKESGDTSMLEALRAAFTHPGFWLLNLGFFACGFQLAFIATHMPSYLIEKGLRIDQAGMTLAIIALTNIIGTYACGRLGGKWHPKYLLCGLYTLRAVAMIIFISVPVTPFRAYFFSAVMGFLWLGTVPLTSGIISQIFGVRYINTLFGFVFFSHQVGGFLGVWLGAYVYGAYHSYDALWLGAITLGFVAALLHWPIDDAPDVRSMLMRPQT